MRLLAALLVVAALLWWLLREDDTARRERAENGARSELVSEETSQVEDPVPDAQPPADGPEETRKPKAQIHRGRVQIRGRDDAPIAGVSFRSDPGLLEFTGPTDDLGWTDWESRKPLPADLVIIDSFLERKHAVQVPVTTIRYPDLLPLHVDFIDGVTGATLHDGSVSLPGSRGKTVHGAHPRIILMAPIVPGDTCSFYLEIEPPAGTAGAQGLHERVRSFVSSQAHAAHLTIPVWPEVTLTVEVRNRSGVQLDFGFLHDAELRIRAKPTDASGRTRVHGVPYFRRARLLLGAGDETYLTWIRRPAQFVRLSRRVPVTFQWEQDQFEDLLRDRREAIREQEIAPRSGDGTVDVLARWTDHDPATGVMVALQRGQFRAVAKCGEVGRTRFENLFPGDYSVAVLDPALAYAERSCSLRAGGKTAITIGPAQGRSVTFVTASGEAIPGARIEALAWYGRIAPPFRDGVQELAAVTGPGGALLWHDFPCGQVLVQARRADQSALEWVESGGRSDRVVLQLKRRR
jgi:hypothetical protein